MALLRGRCRGAGAGGKGEVGAGRMEWLSRRQRRVDGGELRESQSAPVHTPASQLPPYWKVRRVEDEGQE